MKILIVNRFFGGAQIPTGRMAEDVARVLVAEGHEVVALASTGTYAGAEKRAQHGAWSMGHGGNAQARDQQSERLTDQETKRPKDEKTKRQPEGGGQESGALRVEMVQVPKWMPRAVAWVWFTWQARKRIPRLDWDVCVLMTDPPLLPLLARRAARRRDKETKRPKDPKTDRRVAVWLMDLYPEALAASGRLREGNPLYRWYFEKRQKALANADLLVCLGEAQEKRLETKRPKDEETEPGALLTGRVRTVVVPPWDDRGNIALATEGSLKNLALYAGNLGEAHSFEEILAAVPFLPADWTIRFAVRGAKLAELKEKASQSGHGLTRIKDRISPGGCADRTGQECSVLGDPSTRNAPPEGKAIKQESHSRPQGDRQLDELSEAVKLTRMATDESDRHVPTGLGGNAHAGGPPALAVSPPNELKSRSEAQTARGAAEGKPRDQETKGPGAEVEVTGYASEQETPGLLASARVHLITMSPCWEGIVVPSKLYGCIRTGRPVLFIGPENADTAREIRRNDWGVVMPSGASGEEVAAAIMTLAARPTRATAKHSGAEEIAKRLFEVAGI